MRSKKFQELENKGVVGDALREKIVEHLDATEAKRQGAGRSTDEIGRATIDVNKAEIIARSSEAKSGAAKVDRRGDIFHDEEDVVPERSSFGSTALEWVKGAAIAVVLAVVILQFIKPTIVQQKSMEPNFETNDYLFISKQSYRLFRGEPKIGDVIVFTTEMKTDKGDNKLLIKRVIGVPGDEISIAGGKVYVNGEIIDDSYTKDGTTNGDIDKLIVPVDTVFCLGDNRLVSVDSRDDSVGFISYDDILGKVVFRLFPLGKIGTIDNPFEED